MTFERVRTGWRRARGWPCEMAQERSVQASCMACDVSQGAVWPRTVFESNVGDVFVLGYRCVVLRQQSTIESTLATGRVPRVTIVRCVSRVCWRGGHAVAAGRACVASTVRLSYRRVRWSLGPGTR